MDFLKRLFGGKPANSIPAFPNGATSPALPESPTNSTVAVGGKRRSSRRRSKQSRKQSRKNARK
jgi:hypothetical protein